MCTKLHVQAAKEPEQDQEGDLLHAAAVSEVLHISSVLPRVVHDTFACLCTKDKVSLRGICLLMYLSFPPARPGSTLCGSEFSCVSVRALECASGMDTLERRNRHKSRLLWVRRSFPGQSDPSLSSFRAVSRIGFSGSGLQASRRIPSTARRSCLSVDSSPLSRLPPPPPPPPPPPAPALPPPRPSPPPLLRKGFAELTCQPGR